MPSHFWHKRRILVGVCGGIAAYKVCGLVSALAQHDADVRAVLTSAAEAFVPALTVATLSRQPAYTDREFWSAQHGRPLHIDLAEWAEVILVAPLTANTLSKLAAGSADNLLTNTLLASLCPVILAPAMNTQMWENSAVQRNYRLLLEDPRYSWVAPASGRLACDTVGKGRLAEPEVLEQALMSVLWAKGQKDWAGKRVLVTGGGTREPLDAVRFLGNPSSGQMGSALANAAAYRGAEVVYLHGPREADPTPLHPDIEAIDVLTAAQMQSALEQEFPKADYTFMAAAVADVRPRYPSSGKLPKQDLSLHLELDFVPDLVAGLCQHKKPGQTLIGFAAQSGDPVPPAQEKLRRKGLDAIVANPIDQPNSGFASDQNQGVWISAKGEVYLLPLMPKAVLAHHLLDLAGRIQRL